MGQVHYEWLRKVTAAIAEDYARLHEEARKDPQKAGHGGERVWAQVLRDWLPPGYEVETRRYIVPEEGDRTFETDLVVFNRGYPDRLRGETDVLAGGVAAAFSVKLTTDAAGIRDAIARAVELRRALKPRLGSARSEVLGAFPVGLLSHSHDWKAPRSTPEVNVTTALTMLDLELVKHPREALDYVCIADLNTWWVMRIPLLPPAAVAYMRDASPAQKANGMCTTAIMSADLSKSPSPVALFIASLLQRLAYSDPAVKPMAEGLTVTGTRGYGQGAQRRWDLDAVFSERTRQQLPVRGSSQDSVDWLQVYT